MSLVLDAGALLAIDRRDRRVGALPWACSSVPPTAVTSSTHMSRRWPELAIEC